MLETIDLRIYIRLLLTHWKQWIGITVLFMLLAAAFYTVTPTYYEAVALVAITSPQQTIALDPELLVANPQETETPYGAYPEIALSDTVLHNLWDASADLAPEIKTLDDLRDRVAARTGDDRTLVRLIVTNERPDVAAAIVNQWAIAFATHTNQLLGTQDAARQTAYESEYAQAQAEWQAANEAYIDFQRTHSETILRHELNSLDSTLAALLTDSRTVELAIQDIDALITRMAAADPAAPVSIADEITALNLQIKAFDAANSTPIEFSTASFEPRTADELTTALHQIVAALTNKATVVSAEIESLKPQILAAQTTLETLLVEKAELTQAIMVTDEATILLARRVKEEGIRATAVDDAVKVVSQAQPPDTPSPGLLVIVLLAGIVGAMVATLAIFSRAWWRDNLPI